MNCLTSPLRRLWVDTGKCTLIHHVHIHQGFLIYRTVCRVRMLPSIILLDEYRKAGACRMRFVSIFAWKYTDHLVF